MLNPSNVMWALVALAVLAGLWKYSQHRADRWLQLERNRQEFIARLRAERDLNIYLRRHAR